MALDSKNNIKSVFIVPSLTAITPGIKITPGSTNSGTPGTVVMTNMSNEVLATTNTGNWSPALYDRVKIIKDRGADLPLQQLVLTRAQVIAASAVAGKLASEQVTYIGYTGAAGNTDTIQIAADNFYSIKLEHTPNSFAYGKRPANYKYGTFQSPLGIVGGAGNTGGGIVANGLVASLVQNFRPNRTIDWRVFSEVTTNAARSNAGTGNLTFTKYSRTVVASAPGATTGYVAGDYIQSVATLTTQGVYKVKSRDSVTGNLTLEIPYNGNTITGVNAATAIKITAAAALAAAYWGIKITGLKQKYDVNRWRQYDKVRFNTFLEGFPNTATPTTVVTTAAFDGIAVYEQVANDEYISWGDEGQVFVDQVPPLFREQDAAVGTQYSPAVISWLDKLPSLIGAGENKGQAILYLTGATGSADYILPAGTQLALVNTFNTWANVDLPTTFVYTP